jgi:hypothetical protein
MQALFLYDGLQNLRLTEAISEAAKSGKMVEVPTN